MPVLVPMRRQVFSEFAPEANAACPGQCAGRPLGADEAVAKATAEFEQLLPHGIDTTGHFFYEVHDPSANGVGYVWFAVVGAGEARAGYVYNIRTRPVSGRAA